MFGIQERSIATSCLLWIGAHVAVVARDIPRGRKPRELLPTGTPLRLLEADGQAVRPCDLDLPGDDVLLALHRKMVLARRFDTQATALTRQGRLAVYPSARGQEAGEVGAVLALRPQDWLFPTYRDSMAIVCRGVDPVEVLSLLRGDWHCGYDPYEYRVAPQSPPSCQVPKAMRETFSPLRPSLIRPTAVFALDVLIAHSYLFRSSCGPSRSTSNSHGALSVSVSRLLAPLIKRANQACDP